MINNTERITEYPLRSIYFYPTESCNLKCIHCWIKPEHAPDKTSYEKQNQKNISVATMEKVLNDALPLGLSHIKFTGGEPFVNPKLFDFLDTAARYNLSIGIETNGTLLTKNNIKRLKTYKLDRISASLDGSSPKIHERIRGVKGCFSKTVKGIRLLIENKIYPQVIFCLQKLNAHDLENTIRLANNMNVRSFEINPLALLGDNSSAIQGCESLPIEELLRLEKRVENEFTKLYPDMHVNLYLPPALKGIQALSKHRLCSCKIFNICGILSNGDVSICGIGISKKDLIMGNVNERSIFAIWKEGRIFNEIRAKIPSQLKGICGKCLFKLHCLGFCRADVLFNDQSITDPFEICEKVFQKGLFPASRILDEKEFQRTDSHNLP